MSQPLSACMFSKAAIDDVAFITLMEIFKLNHLYYGHYSTFPCVCDPPCKEKYGITKEIIEEYNTKAAKYWEDFMNTHDKTTCASCKSYSGPEGHIGKK